MWPWAHLGLGYLVYTLVVRITTKQVPSAPAALGVVLGTQLPDLVDKPFGWYLGVFPSGRSLAHSAVVLVVVGAIGWVFLQDRAHRRVGIALAVGWAMHLAGDALYPVLRWSTHELAFLAWPLLPPVPPAVEPGVVVYLLAIEPGPALAFELGITAAGIIAWLADGRPGVSLLGSWLSKWIPSR